MEVKVLIAENKTSHGLDLAGYLSEQGYRVVGVTNSADELLDSISKTQPDIIIMNIHINGNVDGIETAKRINLEKRIPLILLTDKSEHGILEKILPLKPEALIAKPFDNYNIKAAVFLACAKNNITTSDALAFEAIDYTKGSIFVKDGSTYKKIAISSILFIEAKGSYSCIMTVARAYTLSYNLNHFINLLRNPCLKRVHRSFVVNLSRVEAIENSSLLINKVSIPVSKQYYKEVMALFLKL